MLANLSRGAMLLVAIVGLALPLGPVAALAQSETPMPGGPAIEQAMPIDDIAPEPPQGAEAGVDRSTLPHDLSPMGMYAQADIVVKSVMIILAVASILTWAIFLSKSLELFGIRHRTRSRDGVRAGSIYGCQTAGVKGNLKAWRRTGPWHVIDISAQRETLPRHVSD